MDDLCSIYVGGLPYECDERSLRTHFEEFGDIVNCKVVYDRDSNTSRGFGFVTFSDADAVDVAIREMDGQTLEGRSIRVNRVKKGQGRNDRSHRRRSPAAYDYSPRRSSPRRSDYSPESDRYRRRSRSRDDSVSPRPSERGRKSDWSRGVSSKKVAISKNWEEKESGVRLRKELNEALDKQLDLKKQLAALEEQMERKMNSEAALQIKVQKLEEQLTATLAACEQKQSSLKKLRKAIRRVQQAEEALQGSQKELKELCARTPVHSEDAGLEDLVSNGRESSL